MKAYANRGYTESVDVSIHLGLEKGKVHEVRGILAVPHGFGKTSRVAVFARDELAQQAKAAGADVVGAEDLVKEIQEGTFDFDRCIATPDMMPLVSRVGRILGPRGLMPNAKLGTVTQDVESVVKSFKSGDKVEYRANRESVVTAPVATIGLNEDAIMENVNHFVNFIARSKPQGSTAKGAYVKKVTLSSTMGPGIELPMVSKKKRK
eukprot:TRINITY_DN5280_c0_g1_i1.p2 TRINITY_DN5280_c0_g1~~TRINITY_DN5280_c0_g1_i1.p2  ORF type:complete len:207 (-),score=56.45 TRINITY_DN5280_c0_g1_i1:70-690(-)